MENTTRQPSRPIDDLDQNCIAAWSEFRDGLEQTKKHIIESDPYLSPAQRTVCRFVFHMVYTCAWLAWAGFKIVMRTRRD
jgi:hypothetical protein